MSIDRTVFNTWVDDRISAGNGTTFGKAEIAAGILDPVDAALGASPTYKAKTSGYTAVANDLVVATSGTFIVTLPAAASNANKMIWVVNNGTGVVTVSRIGSDTVGLATAVQTLAAATATRQGDSMTFISDGISNWVIV